MGIPVARHTRPKTFMGKLMRSRGARQARRNRDLPAILQIAGHEPIIRDKLRHTIERSMMGPSAQALNEDERPPRSSLTAAQLMGLTFMRFCWKIEPLASMDDDGVGAAIAPTIQRYLEDDVQAATR